MPSVCLFIALNTNALESDSTIERIRLCRSGSVAVPCQFKTTQEVRRGRVLHGLPCSPTAKWLKMTRGPLAIRAAVCMSLPVGGKPLRRMESSQAIREPASALEVHVWQRYCMTNSAHAHETHERLTRPNTTRPVLTNRVQVPEPLRESMGKVASVKRRHDVFGVLGCSRPENATQLDATAILFDCLAGTGTMRN